MAAMKSELNKGKSLTFTRLFVTFFHSVLFFLRFFLPISFLYFLFSLSLSLSLSLFPSPLLSSLTHIYTLFFFIILKQICFMLYLLK